MENLNETVNEKVENDEWDKSIELESEYYIKLEPVIQDEGKVDASMEPIFIGPTDFPLDTEYDSSSTHDQPPEVELEASRKNNRICKQCEKVFANNASLQIHHRRCHKPVKCKRCLETFHGMDSFRAHATSHYNEITQCFPCPLCSKEISTVEKLFKHLKQAHADRRYSCNVCETSFKQSNHLRQHIASLHNPGNHPCSLCSKVYPTTLLLKRHHKRKHLNVSVQE